MSRILVLVACLLWLAGCASTPSYRYYGERTYSDGYGGEVVASPSSAYRGGGWDTPVWYDYPAYYSMFWSINRWYVDPYWYPHFYYGVTWFPRDYFSVSYRHWYGPSLRIGWFGRPWYGYLAYSPYRYSWVDHYYDWYPWYANYPHYHRYYGPRYGDPRNEAERLTRYSTAFRGDGLPADQLRGMSAFTRAARSQALVDARREAWRGADYGGAPRAGRIDPQVNGFSQGNAVRRASTARGSATPLQRQDPGVRGFSTPEQRPGARTLPARSAPRNDRVWREEGIAYPARSRPTPSREVSTSRPASRAAITTPAPRSERIPRSYERDPQPARSLPQARPRYSEPPVRSTERSVDSYSAARREAPSYTPAPTMRSSPAPREAPSRYVPPQREAPRYQAPRAEPRSYSAPTPAPRERAAPVMRGDAPRERPTREEE